MSIALKIFNSNRILVVGLPSHAAASSAIEEYRMGEKEWSNWTEILAECWSSSNSSSNIRNGFKAAGLWLATRYWILWQDYPCSLLRQGLKGSFRGVNLEVSAVRCSWNQSILQGEFMAMQIYMSIKQRKKWLKLGKICWESPIQILNETDRIDKLVEVKANQEKPVSSAPPQGQEKNQSYWWSWSWDCWWWRNISKTETNVTFLLVEKRLKISCTEENETDITLTWVALYTVEPSNIMRRD